MMPQKRQTYPPVTLGQIRGHGCRNLLIYCESLWCNHSAVMNADRLPDEMPLRALCPRMVCTASGFIGGLWKRFSNGTVLEPRLLKNEGVNFVAPWNQVFLYDLRLQSFTESYNAISSDGVNLNASVVVRFRLQRDAVPVLHQAIGPNYEQVLIQPGIGSLTREVIAQYTPEQVYSTARQEIQDKIRDLVENRLSEKMMEHEGEESYRVSMRDTIILYDILVTGIELPAAIVAAINRKTEQYYIAEEYKFRVEREKS